MSKPKKVYTPEEIAQVEALAAYGHTLEEIIKFLGVKDTSFRCARKENVVLNEAYIRGRFQARNHVISRLMRYINSDELSAVNFNAISLYLRTQAGWSDKQNINLSNEDGSLKTPVKMLVEFANDKSTE